MWDLACLQIIALEKSDHRFRKLPSLGAMAKTPDSQEAMAAMTTWWLIPRIVSGLQAWFFSWDKWGQSPLFLLG